MNVPLTPVDLSRHGPLIYFSIFNARTKNLLPLCMFYSLLFTFIMYKCLIFLSRQPMDIDESDDSDDVNALGLQILFDIF